MVYSYLLAPTSASRLIWLQFDLKHPHHSTFHKTHVSDEDEARGFTRFNRWSVNTHTREYPQATDVPNNRHMDAALYDLSPYVQPVFEHPRSVLTQ